MARYKGHIWGEWGEFKTKSGAMSSARSLRKAQERDNKRYPDSTGAKATYYYDVMKRGKYWIGLYRYE